MESSSIYLIEDAVVVTVSQHEQYQHLLTVEYQNVFHEKSLVEAHWMDVVTSSCVKD